MYTVDNIHSLLLEQKLISMRSFVNGDYEATSVNRRNQNLRITTLAEGNYLVKQVQDKEAVNAVTVRREIDFYRTLKTTVPELAALCPQHIYSDRDRIILMIELFEKAMPLWKYYRIKTIEHMPLATVEAIAVLLATVHRRLAEPKVLGHPNFEFLSQDLPFAFGMTQPDPAILTFIRQGSLQFLQNLQANADILEILAAVRELWQLNAVIHGDIKLDNFLVLGEDKSIRNASSDVRLIDWEMLQFGDFAWDVAGVFQDKIFWWAQSMPQRDTPEEMAQAAQFPINRLAPSMQKFWEIYCRTSEFSAEYERQLLHKVVRYAGLRTLQTAYEVCSRFDEIPPVGAILLGIGKSILRKPEEAAIHLFGFKPEVLDVN